MNDLIRAAEDLSTRIATQRAAHFAASDRLGLIHYVLGFLLISVSAVVSGTVLQATNGNPSEALTITAGALGAVVVVLTSVQTTFKLGERAEQHRSAAAGFGRIQRRLEIFIHRRHPDADRAWDELLAIAEDIGNVETGAPGFLRSSYERARRDVVSDLAGKRPLE